MERLAATGKAPDRLEQESIEFFENVANGFRTLVAEDPAHKILLDAEQSAEVLAETVYRRMMALIKAE